MEPPTGMMYGDRPGHTSHSNSTEKHMHWHNRGFPKQNPHAFHTERTTKTHRKMYTLTQSQQHTNTHSHNRDNTQTHKHTNTLTHKHSHSLAHIHSHRATLAVTTQQVTPVRTLSQQLPLNRRQ